MNSIITGVIAGVLGTIAMDSLNYLFAQKGFLVKIDVKMIGRMSAGWINGRFCYRDPSQMKPEAKEGPLGYVIHYAIGIALAIPFVLGWELLVGGPVSPIWVLVYGVATTAASVFVVYPSMGLGVFGMRSPEGIRAPLSSLANHFFFGIGMAVGVVLT